jgi:hypothetical protein
MIESKSAANVKKQWEELEQLVCAACSISSKVEEEKRIFPKNGNFFFFSATIIWASLSII